MVENGVEEHNHEVLFSMKALQFAANDNGNQIYRKNRFLLKISVFWIFSLLFLHFFSRHLLCPRIRTCMFGHGHRVHQILREQNTFTPTRPKRETICVIQLRKASCNKNAWTYQTVDWFQLVHTSKTSQKKSTTRFCQWIWYYWAKRPYNKIKKAEQ